MLTSRPSSYRPGPAHAERTAHELPAGGKSLPDVPGFLEYAEGCIGVQPVIRRAPLGESLLFARLGPGDILWTYKSHHRLDAERG